MRSGWNKRDKYLLFDAGPFGYGHQHEDKLNIVAYTYGDVLITEPGTYIYDHSKWRRYVRSTFAHNTITVDGMEQNRRKLKNTYVTKKTLPNPFITTSLFDYVSGSYNDGYGPKNDKSVTHTRKILFLKPDYWVVIDRFTGSGEHIAQACYHLNADEAKMDDKKSICTTNAEGPNILIKPLNPEFLSAKVIKGQEEPVLGWIPAQKRMIPTAVFTNKGKLPLSYEILLYPFPGRVKEVRVEKLEIEGVSAFLVEDKDLIYISHTSGRRSFKWEDNAIDVEAEILVIRKSSEASYYGLANMRSFNVSGISLNFQKPLNVNLAIQNNRNFKNSWIR